MTTSFLASTHAVCFVTLCAVILSVGDALPQFSVTLHRHQTRVFADEEEKYISYKHVYYGDVLLGSPVQQRMTVAFDTGSGYVVAPSVDCTSSSCMVHERYDHRASVLAEDVNMDGTRVNAVEPRDEMVLSYGTGEIVGQFSSDKLCIDLGQKEDPDLVGPDGRGRHLESPLTQSPSLMQRGWTLQKAPEVEERGCVSLIVVKALQMSEDPFGSFVFDGVLGLGPKVLSAVPECNFFHQMILQGRLSESVFAVFLGNKDEESEINFGGIQPELMASPLVWVPVALPELGHWQVKVDHLRLGGNTLPYCEDGTCRAVVDSGTSALTLPGEIRDTVAHQLDSVLVRSDNIDGTSECHTTQDSKLEFDVGGITLSLGPQDFARKIYLNTEENSDDTIEDDQREFLCRATILGLTLEAPLGPKLFILGDPVLTKYYTAYDVEFDRIGFALAQHG
mmetsp:Transcript_54443/g.145253  ORF Transcript_54443/g.145253 Transcript_54443/m.145253 type:complete len:450 (-) Transcript_54443:899-2248(-)